MRRILFILTMSLLILTLNAQDFKVDVPQEVQVKKTFTVSYEIFWEDQRIDPNSLHPEIYDIKEDSLKLIMGPSINTTTSYKETNGKIGISTSIKYDYIFKALKVGKLTIPRLNLLKNDSIIFTSEKCYINILNHDNQSSEQNKENAVSSENNATQILELKFETEKQSCELTDSIRCNLVLYTDQILNSISFIHPLSIDYCYYETIDEVNEPITEDLDGQKVTKYYISSYIVKPLAKGILTIHPLKAIVTKLVFKDSDKSFFGESEYVDVLCETKEIELKVE